MKKALKELIENAPVKLKGDFYMFLIVSNGVYDGFWGKNGYNNIIILAKEQNDKTKTWYKLSEYADKFDIFPLFESGTTIRSFDLDIPKEYGVPRIWFDKAIRIDYTIQTSDVIGHPIV